MNEYCKILDVSENATVEEIKRAYRKKVTTTHPDVNPSENAHEEFIELNQAYEYLINQKTGRSFNSKENQYTRQRADVSREEFMKEARERARANARMKYEEFIQSPYYQSQVIYFAVLDYLILAIIFLLFGTIFGLLIVNLGWHGLIYSLFFTALLAVAFKNSSSNIKRLSFVEIKEGFRMLFEYDFAKALPLIIFNNFTFFNLGFATFLPLKYLFSLFFILPAILQVTHFLYGKSKNVNSTPSQEEELNPRKINFISRNPILTYWGIVPLLFSIFLTTNYYFSANSRVEKHHYTVEIQGGEISWMASLENKKYEEYGGIRYFFDTDGFFSSHYVTLEIETGYWGIDVLKGYKVSKR